MNFLLGLNWRFVLIGLLLSVTAYISYTYSNNQWARKFAEKESEVAYLQVKVKDLEVKSSKVTTKIVTEYVDKIHVVEVKGDTIIKEVPVYVTAKSDNQCVIPTGFVLIHNTAASNGDLPRTTGDTNEKASGVALSTVAETVTVNYKQYHETIQQLLALQEWVKQQQKLLNTEIHR